MASIRCGACKERHASTEEVLACFRKHNDLPLPTRTQPPIRKDQPTDKQLHYVGALLERRPSIARSLTKGIREMNRREVSELIERCKVTPPETSTSWDPSKLVADIVGNVPPDGRYTVVMSNDRRTINFHTPKQGQFANTTLVKYLSGSDNDSDYTAFGQVVNGGVYIWKKYKGSEILIRAVTFLLRGSESDWADAGEMYALASSNCFRCGRTLTVPTSIHRGMGPDCAAKGWS